MTKKKKRPEPGSKKFWEWVRKRAEERAEQLKNAGPAEFDETGLISGGLEELESADSESFPDESKEFTPQEPKLRPVKKVKPPDQK